jgi:hypothetical protein
MVQRDGSDRPYQTSRLCSQVSLLPFFSLRRPPLRWELLIPNRVQAGLRARCDDILTGSPDRPVLLPPDARIEIVDIGPVESLAQTIKRCAGAPLHGASALRDPVRVPMAESAETLNRLPWHLREVVKRDQTLGGLVERAYVDLDETDSENLQRVLPRRIPDGYELCTDLNRSRPEY